MDLYAIILTFIMGITLCSSDITNNEQVKALQPHTTAIAEVADADNTPKISLPKTKPVLDISFENSLNKEWMREMADNEYAGTFSTKYVRQGSYSYRIELRKTDPEVLGGKRSEISVIKPEPAADECVYQFSVLLPEGGMEDYAIDPEGSEIIAQWHNVPDPGEKGTYPPLALYTKGNGYYVLVRCWDADPMSSEAKMDAERKKVSYVLGSYLDDKGKWVDWTFHVKWGWLESQNPSIRVYKNGTMVFDLKDEPNTTNDEQGVRMKLGIYKWDWGQTEGINGSILTNRVIYYDHVSIKQVID